ncbi:mannitol dehydrogenase family protein [Leifsonia poae]|uniref:mannitol dehydrogenase family protein n=1 Tax=Leifsonia poae TaxID=110933 RepID=UPI001CBF1FFB|nr:mannitol dehydrogenase family protein [Leifsonia poae]
MTPPPRAERHPVRIVHLGLGAFHRAHQAWYTQRANERGDRAGGAGWGIAAFTGRSPEGARVLAAQDAVYTLIERGPESDAATIVDALSTVADGGDTARWRSAVADPAVAVLTLTVTEAGYRPPAEALDADRASLAAGDGAATAPGRLVDGLRARRAAGAGGIAVVSCDNLPNNGRVARNAVLGLASDVDPGLAEWIEGSVSFVSSMVDRITPAATDADREAAARLTGYDDAAPVVTEPFSEWVLSGDFPAGRPAWEAVGAQFVADIEPYERRKLWLLNAGHSLLAYRGLLSGYTTIAEAMRDVDIVGDLEALWAEARTELPFDVETVDATLAALRDRFGNARIEHRLAQIASDGSQKLGPRILDPLRLRLTDGRGPGEAQAGVLAAWALHLLGDDVRDPAAIALVVRLRANPDDDGALATAVLTELAPDLAGVSAVTDLIHSRIAHLRAGTTTEPPLPTGAH